MEDGISREFAEKFDITDGVATIRHIPLAKTAKASDGLQSGLSTHCVMRLCRTHCQMHRYRCALTSVLRLLAKRDVERRHRCRI